VALRVTAGDLHHEVSDLSAFPAFPSGPDRQNDHARSGRDLLLEPTSAGVKCFVRKGQQRSLNLAGVGGAIEAIVVWCIQRDDGAARSGIVIHTELPFIL
jgi:hypothetical protein